jgi:hypothetical protein
MMMTLVAVQYCLGLLQAVGSTLMVWQLTMGRAAAGRELLPLGLADLGAATPVIEEKVLLLTP